LLSNLSMISIFYVVIMLSLFALKKSWYRNSCGAKE